MNKCKNKEEKKKELTYEDLKIAVEISFNRGYHQGFKDGTTMRDDREEAYEHILQEWI
jgi:hypothetical protein